MHSYDISHRYHDNIIAFPIVRKKENVFVSVLFIFADFFLIY